MSAADNVIDLPPPKATLETVRAVAKRYPVFPCRPKEETLDGRTYLAKSPRTAKGFYDATRKGPTIQAWWNGSPDSLVAVPTGSKTGIVAIDYDGLEGAAWYEAHQHRLPLTQINKTRRGGHLLFAYPDNEKIGSGTNVVAPKVDVRANGGYVIWWPAHGYPVENEGVVAELPDWLLSQLRKRAQKPKSNIEIGGLAESQLTQVLAQIPADDYGTWIQVGQILRDEYDTEPDRWIAWSKRSPRFKSDADCRNKWSTFNGKGLTTGTLVHLAGGLVPPTSAEEDFGDAPVDPADDGADLLDDEPSAKKKKKSDSGGTIPVLDVETFLRRARPTWRIKNLLPESGLALIFGASGSGKTFFTLDLVGSIIAGGVWGRSGLLIRPGRAVYVAAEGPGGFRNRVEALKLDGRKLDGLSVIPSTPLITTDKEANRLIDAIKGIGGTDVIVLDTLSQVTSGLDENSAEMSHALRAATRLREAFNCLVIFVGHSGKDPTKGHRGWTGVFAAVDTAIEVTKSDDIRTATITKQRDGECDVSYSFYLSPVTIGTDDDGDAITTCLLDHCDTPLTRKAPAMKSRRGGIQGLILDEIPPEGADEKEVVRKVAATRKPGSTEGRRPENIARALNTLVGKKIVVRDGNIVRIST